MENNMNMFDEARALLGTIQMCGITQEEIAKKLNVSQSYVANKLRLLKFSAHMQEKIIACGICERLSRALLRIKDERLQESALTQMAERQMTVADGEALIEALCKKQEDKPCLRSDLDRGLASCLTLLRLYGTVSEHRVCESEGEIIFTVRMRR